MNENRNHIFYKFFTNARLGLISDYFFNEPFIHLIKKYFEFKAGLSILMKIQLPQTAYREEMVRLCSGHDTLFGYGAVSFHSDRGIGFSAENR